MKKISDQFTEITHDTQSGSVSILQRIIDLLRSDALKHKDLPEVLKIYLPQIDAQLSPFAVVKHFVTELEIFLKSHKKYVVDKKNLKRFLQKYDNKWKAVNWEIANNAYQNIDFLNKTILVHSNSSAVVALFTKLMEHQVKCRIFQTKSPPENEGLIQKRKLTAIGHDVTLIDDEMVWKFIPEVDLVVFGADQVYNNCFVNKSGSYVIALRANEKNIPCFVLADSRKFCAQDIEPNKILLPYSSGSIDFNHFSRQIPLLQKYFEAIPAFLISAFVTEGSIETNTQLTE